MRCTTATRTCGGYEDHSNFIVQQYDSHNGGLTPFKFIARKCSLPVQERPLGAGSSIESDVPRKVPDEVSDRLALSAFFYDYCVVSTNPALSRGFLSGLEKTLQRLGFESNLAKACKLAYHLVEDLHVFYRNLGDENSSVNPGRSVAGLLLVQPLHVASNLSIVNPWIRKY